MGVTEEAEEADWGTGVEAEVAALVASEGERGATGSGGGGAGVEDTGIRGKIRTSGSNALRRVYVSSG
jgi:hypothetical protein